MRPKGIFRLFDENMIAWEYFNYVLLWFFTTACFWHADQTDYCYTVHVRLRQLYDIFWGLFHTWHVKFSPWIYAWHPNCPLRKSCHLHAKQPYHISVFMTAPTEQPDSSFAWTWLITVSNQHHALRKVRMTTLVPFCWSRLGKVAATAAPYPMVGRLCQDP